MIRKPGDTPIFFFDRDPRERKPDAPVAAAPVIPDVQWIDQWNADSMDAAVEQAVASLMNDPDISGPPRIILGDGFEEVIDSKGEKVIIPAGETYVEQPYARSERLSELILVEHAAPDLYGASPYNAPTKEEKVHSERLEATKLFAQDAVELGEKPVLPPMPDGKGGLIRPRHTIPAWACREESNLPILNPGEYYLPSDLFDFQVHKRSPSILAAAEEIIAAFPKSLEVENPEAEKLLSPLAGLILFSARHHFKGGGLKHHYDGTMNSFVEFGLLQTAVMQVFSSAAKNNLTAAEDVRTKWPGGKELVDAIQEAIPPQRGLQQILNRAHFPIEPTGNDVPLTREEAESCAQSNPQALDEMVAQAPIPKTMPLLEEAKSLIPDNHFSDCHLVAVQHVLATNVTMFDALISKGLDPSKAEIIGIPYSTNYVCEHALRSKGFRITTPFVVNPNDVSDAYERALGPALERAIARSMEDGKKILLLDDGGKASKYIATHFPEHAHRFRGVEQTTRGLTELSLLERIPFPIVNVAKSLLKKLEAGTIGQQVIEACLKLMLQIGLEGCQGRTVGVVGYGDVGRSIASTLKAMGANVMVWDEWDKNPEKRAEAVANGFIVPNSRREFFSSPSMLIGASGHRSITREDLDLLPHECVIASSSSRDIEIDLSVNVDYQVQNVPLLAAGRGDRRFITRVWRFPGKDLIVLRNGFPVNFDGDYETSTNESIEMTRAIMLLGAAQTLGEDDSKLVDLDRSGQEVLAEKAGIEMPVA